MKSWEKDKNDPTLNEFYTLYEQAELVLSPLKEHFMNKRIVCPCDTEESNIVKWLRDNTNSEVISSSIDVNSEEARELMLTADMIVTNPPFSLKVFSPFFKWLYDNNKDYFIWGPLLVCSGGGSLGLYPYIKYLYKPIKGNHVYMYDRPDGLKKPASTAFYTSIDVPYLDYDYKPAKEQEFFEGIPVFNKTRNIPKDYYDWMWVPVTAMPMIKYYEISKSGGPNGHFIRLLIRRINNDTSKLVSRIR